MKMAIKDEAKINENFLKEIESLNKQLNAALRGACSSRDMSSEVVLLLLEQKLKGYELIKESDCVNT